MKNLLSVLFIAIISNLSAKVYANDEITIRAGVETGFSLSYTGFSQNLLLIARSGAATVYAGPRIMLTQSYLPRNGVYGAAAGIRFRIAETGRFSSFFNIDYQNSVMRPFGDYTPRQFNFIHELNFAYGATIRLSPKFAIGNLIGFGRYRAIYHDLNESRRAGFNGYSGLIRLFGVYEF